MVILTPASPCASIPTSPANYHFHTYNQDYILEDHERSIPHVEWEIGTRTEAKYTHYPRNIPEIGFESCIPTPPDQTPLQAEYQTHQTPKCLTSASYKTRGAKGQEAYGYTRATRARAYTFIPVRRPIRLMGIQTADNRLDLD
jgi:hypothetical protein